MIIIFILFLFLILIGIGAAYLSTSSDEDKSTVTVPVTVPVTAPAAPAAPAPAAPVPTPTSTDVSAYKEFPNLTLDHGECDEDATFEKCTNECKYDPKCVGFTWNKDEQKCCYLTGVSGKKYDEYTKTYIKKIDRHNIQDVGNRTGGYVIKTIENADPMKCGIECSEKPGCYGFSYEGGTCKLKRPPGLNSTHYDDGKQFYTNSNPLEGREVFNVYGLEGTRAYNVGKNQRDLVCEKFEAEVATEAQLQAAYDNGAEWCVLGWYKDPDNIGMPIQTSSPGCGSAGFQKRGAADGSKSGVHCYGFKPKQDSDNRISKFNVDKWSRYD
jgi:hypothetical protein